MAAFLSLLSLLFLSQPSQALDACYSIEIINGPETSVIQSREQRQVWCYRHLESPVGTTFIYNADSPTVKQELSALLTADGRLLHASLLNGEMTFHQVDSSVFNPLNIPLREPTTAPTVIPLNALSPEFLISSEESLRQLQTQNPPLSALRIQEGTFEESVSDSALPWRGYWWPYNGQPLSGTTNSPLAKYDRFVQARTGASPGAAAWENSRHRYKGISWEGHCNGWAASAIIRREPSYPKYDSVSGVTFSVSDQKGILAEKDYCVVTAFYGNRYPRPGRDIRDIFPAEFHRVLTYYIGDLGKPVAFDRMRDASVDNHIISGYLMQIRQTNAQSFTVTATLNAHKYDSSRYFDPGIAVQYTKVYRYTLQTDASGNIIGGSWLTTNPDFLWVPLSPGTCPSNNPRVDGSYVNQILNLPRD